LQVFSGFRFGASFSSAGRAAGASVATRAPSTTKEIAAFSNPEAPRAFRIIGR